ncbi:hypothetical protein D9758_011426 [Tetrapyrgos nigripes]|uniref:Glucose-methanol-choline oxidoreductase N-terminal domain-containing protein n=1 Tax=Tetrapyrgos nigripes TaxID=182062 RepID=A0A8H5CQ59_9AGAR|nr:hypothetical protein D9758_011426 [Tetrapyrgos nigripes]
MGSDTSDPDSESPIRATLPSMPLVSLDIALRRSFDYIVIGGGTAGLTLASRLSESPDISVLVLEAGDANLDDPLITRPAQYGAHFMKPEYDWGFKTVPQRYAANNQSFWPRGKGLGGSSSINFHVWSVPPKYDIDAWERLGNPGWNWEMYEKYAEQCVTYRPVPSSNEALNVWDSKKSFGSGPLKLSYPITISDLDWKMQEALINLGINRSAAPYHGDTTGVYAALNTLDPATVSRSYSATAFYQPITTRPNLFVLPNAHVHRILSEGEHDNVVASGVEFRYRTDKTAYVVKVNKEVILCAGALKSPAVLEHSGIGRPDILKKLNVPVKVALDGVGEHVQEHQYIGLAFELKPGVPDETLDLSRDEAINAKQLELYAKRQGIYTMGIVSFAFVPPSTIMGEALAKSMYESQKQKIEAESEKYNPGLKDQYTIMLERLKGEQTGGCEIIGFPGFLSSPNPPVPGKKYYSILAATNHCFSRGHIHATSPDPQADPEIDPNYFEHDIDLKVYIEIVKYIRKVARTEPLADSLSEELNPGALVQTDEQIAEWIMKNASTTYHTAGSLSMLPREKNGVVDPELKVYGTKNIRVADLSIVPLHFSGHSQGEYQAVSSAIATVLTPSLLFLSANHDVLLFFYHILLFPPSSFRLFHDVCLTVNRFRQPSSATAYVIGGRADLE